MSIVMARAVGRGRIRLRPRDDNAANDVASARSRETHRACAALQSRSWSRSAGNDNVPTSADRTSLDTHAPAGSAGWLCTGVWFRVVVRRGPPGMDCTRSFGQCTLVVGQSQWIVPAHRDHQVVSGGQIMLQISKRLAEQTLDSIPSHRVAYSSRNAETQTWVTQRVRQSTNNQRSHADRSTLDEDRSKVVGAGETKSAWEGVASPNWIARLERHA